MKLKTIFMTLISFCIMGTPLGIVKAQATNGQLIFILEVDGDAEIFSINSDGTNLTQITSNNNGANDPKFSPQGDKIAFVRDRIIYLMDEDGSNQTMIIGTFGANSIDWSPDGSKLLFDVDGDIALINLSTLAITFLTNTYPEVDLAPTWSPDGSRIAFVSTGDRGVWSPLEGELLFDLHVMNSDGSNRQVFVIDTFGLAGVGSINWLSEDVLIYKSGVSESKIQSFNLLTEESTTLSDPEISSSSPVISPDGSKIAFLRQGQIATMNIDGSNVEVITNISGTKRQLSWQPILVPCDHSIIAGDVSGFVSAVNSANADPDATTICDDE